MIQREDGKQHYYKVIVRDEGGPLSSYFRYATSTSNCKVYFVELLGRCLKDHPNSTIKALKGQMSRVAFFVHLMDKEWIELLEKHFTLIYCNEVPIRYGNNPQYHALFFSDNDSPQKTNYLENEIQT